MLMLKSRAHLTTGSLLLALWMLPAGAHHSYTQYHMDKSATLEGTVTKFVWQAPHSHIFVMSAPPGETGPAVEWNIEATPPNIMSRQGWNKLTLKAGDRITIGYHPLRSNAAGGAMMYAIVNGKVMYNDAARPPVAGAPAPTGAPAQ